MRLTLALLALLVASGASAQGTGTVAGQVFAADGVTALIGATVRLDATSLGAATDVDGNYRVVGVPVGAYVVTASYTGYAPQTQAVVDVDAGATRRLNFTLAALPLEDSYCVGCYYQPIIPRDVYTPRVLIGEDLARMPVNR